MARPKHKIKKSKKKIKKQIIFWDQFINVKYLLIFIIIYIILARFIFLNFDKSMPYLLTVGYALSFFGIIALIIINFKKLKLQFISVSKISWIIILVIVLFAIGIRWFLIPPFHGTYMDEPAHIDAAKNMYYDQRAEICEPIFEKRVCEVTYFPGGWSFIMTVGFILFGVSNIVAINLGSFFGVLSIILAFLLSYLVFKDDLAAIFSSLIMAFFSLYLFWSSTANAIIIAVFLSLLSSVTFLVALRHKDFKLNILFWLSFLLMVYARSELFILIVPFGLYFLFNLKKNIFKNYFFIPCLIFLLISLPFLAYVPYQIDVQHKFIDSKSDLSVFSLKLFLLQSSTGVRNLISGNFFHIFLVLLGVLGIFVCLFKFKKYGFLVLLFAAMFFIYNLWNRTGQTRHSVPELCIFCIFIGWGTSYMLRRLSAIIRTKWIIKLLPFAFAIIVLAILLPTINATVQKAKTYHVLLASLPEHLEKTIDPDCYIIVEEPMILSSSTKLKIVSLPDFLDNTDDMIDHLSQTKCVLFFETPYCNRGNCEKIRKNYKLGTVSGFKRGVEKWTLYNISFSGSVV